MRSRLDGIKSRIRHSVSTSEGGSSYNAGHQIVFWTVVALFVAILFIPENPLIRFGEGRPAPEDYIARLTFTYTDSVSEPIVVASGTKIVSKGTSVSKHDMALIAREADEWNSQNGGPRGLAVRGVAIILVVLISIALFTLFVNAQDPRGHNSRQLLVLGTLFASAILCGKLLSLFASTSLWLFAPLALVAIIGAIAFTPLLSATASAFCMPILLIACWPGVATAVALSLGAVVAPFISTHARKRAHLLRAGFLIGMVHFLVIVSFGLFTNSDMQPIAVQGLIGLLAGVATGAAATFLMPLIEWLFGVVTEISLIELSDLNHPLLKELLIKSSGTYQHSLLVATLSENVASTIGANALICKVGSLFHDIGKLVRPQYFVENNPTSTELHDKLRPSLSAMLIISHTKDGAELAREYGLPQPIIDIIEQHQGTTLVEYFYRKARGKDNSETPDLQLFQYPGPKPLTREAAIVMISDTVEAACRTLKNPSPSRIQEMVHSLIVKKLHESQFDQCDITMRDLNEIEKRLCYLLHSMYHQRIEYTTDSGTEKKPVQPLNPVVKEG